MMLMCVYDYMSGVHLNPQLYCFKIVLVGADLSLAACIIGRKDFYPSMAIIVLELQSYQLLKFYF